MSKSAQNSEKLPVERAIERLRIVDVYMSSIKADLAEEYHPGRGSEELSVQYRHAWKNIHTLEALGDANQGTSPKVLDYVVETAARLVPTSADEATLADSDAAEKLVCAEIIAKFVARYAVLGGDDLDEEAKRAFADENVLYHIWPYWREFLQTTLLRMNLLTRQLNSVPIKVESGRMSTWKRQMHAHCHRRRRSTCASKRFG